MNLRRSMPNVLRALKEKRAAGCLSAVQTINHQWWQVDYDPLSVFMCLWDWEETHSPDTVKWTKWCKKRKATAVSEEGLLSESWIKYCCFTAQLSWGKLCFIVTDTRLPFGENIPKEYSTQVQPGRTSCTTFDVALWNGQCETERFQTQTILEIHFYIWELKQ